MSAITESEMIQEFFELWEAKVNEGKMSPMAALTELKTERPDLVGCYCRGGKTPMAKLMAGKGGK